MRTLGDAAKVAVPIGATGPASGTSLYPLMLNNLVGTKFDIIPGYKHTEMLLAVERGETYGAFTSLATLKTTYPTWIPNKRVHLLVAISPEKVPELAGVPDLLSLAKSAADRQVFAIFASASTIGRSIMTTPRVPAERVAALRAAFDGMIKDPEFLAEIAKTHAEFGPDAGRGAAEIHRRHPHCAARRAGARPRGRDGKTLSSRRRRGIPQAPMLFRPRHRGGSARLHPAFLQPRSRPPARL